MACLLPVLDGGEVMDTPKHPPDVGQLQREAIARRLVDLARPLLDEAARLLDDTHPPTPKEG